MDRLGGGQTRRRNAVLLRCAQRRVLRHVQPVRRRSLPGLTPRQLVGLVALTAAQRQRCGPPQARGRGGPGARTTTSPQLREHQVITPDQFRESTLIPTAGGNPPTVVLYAVLALPSPPCRGRWLASRSYALRDQIPSRQAAGRNVVPPGGRAHPDDANFASFRRPSHILLNARTRSRKLRLRASTTTTWRGARSRSARLLRGDGRRRLSELCRAAPVSSTPRQSANGGLPGIALQLPAANQAVAAWNCEGANPK